MYFNLAFHHTAHMYYDTVEETWKQLLLVDRRLSRSWIRASRTLIRFRRRRRTWWSDLTRTRRCCRRSWLTWRPSGTKCRHWAPTSDSDSATLTPRSGVCCVNNNNHSLANTALIMAHVYGISYGITQFYLPPSTSTDGWAIVLLLLAAQHHRTLAGTCFPSRVE